MGYGNRCGKLSAPAPDGCSESESSGRWYQVGAQLVGLDDLGLPGGAPLDLWWGLSMGDLGGGTLGAAAGGTLGAAVGITLGAGAGVR